VILADQANVAYANTLQLAINQLVGSGPGPVTNPPVTITPAVLAQISDLVTQANVHYAAAYAALKSGDLSTYASEMAQVGKLLNQLKNLTAGTLPKPTPGGTPTPTPSPSPSP
jgi:uncharacterized membrane protein (UPF0182 family)